MTKPSPPRAGIVIGSYTARAMGISRSAHPLMLNSGWGAKGSVPVSFS